MADPDPHQMVTCPYNKSHQLEHYRFHMHLQKCRKQYPNCPKQTCPFDATHIINDVELDYHVTVCPKRAIFDHQRFDFGDSYTPPVEVQPIPKLPAAHIEENWDDEPSTSYKPDPKKKGSHIITKVKGATPSERRKARMDGVKSYKPPEPENQ
ncbi:hypothetical protein ACJJTC_011302 [Scirpophaga incertulas]